MRSMALCLMSGTECCRIQMQSNTAIPLKILANEALVVDETDVRMPSGWTGCIRIPFDREGDYLARHNILGQCAVFVRLPDGLQDEHTYVVTHGFTIGRASANDVCYQEDSISATHGAVFRTDNHGWYYCDFSSNGTYLNGSIIHGQATALKDGDELLFPPLLTCRLKQGEFVINHPGCLKHIRL